MRRRLGRAVDIGALLLVVALFVFLISRILEPDGPGAPAAEPTVLAGDPDAHEFLDRDPATNEPIRFNPCETLHYVINFSSAPANADEMVDNAVRIVSEATGIKFKYDGPTDERVSVDVVDASVDRRPYQPERYGQRWAPILFVWQPLQEALGIEPRDGAWVGGLAFPDDLRLADGTHRYVTGVVILEPDRGRSRTAPALIVLHELLHVMGLGHVDDEQQIMDGDAQGVVRLGAGDVAGLKRVGRDAGCMPPVDPASHFRS